MSTATDSSTTTYSDNSGSSGSTGSGGTSDGSSTTPTSPGPSSSAGNGTSVPIDSGETDANTWTAQLASIPVGNDAQLQAEYQGISAAIPDVKVVNSSDFGSLTPGYWVIYHPGRFSDGSAAFGYCQEQGRSIPQDCFGRYVSHDAGDAKLLCYGTPTAASVDTCTRHFRP